ncbi:PP2C family protein-serine/threonine phosphatase [Actinacidiphila glaucinigra]|uniref:PP2C family protein-serine/threonine phosphatase n=1 Tax=Actinacidiphila glaucinigra TaxID=235986 RepID=UPI0036B25235
MDGRQGGAPGCARCGGTVAPDGHCWDCGVAQPAFRSRVEATAGGAAGVSDRGKRREVNADAMAVTTAGAWTIGVVCDGVSMSPRSERAARLAAEVASGALAPALLSGTAPEIALEDATRRAGRAVAALAVSPDEAPACTFVAGVTGPGGLWCAWIGDSRAYWLPDEGLAIALTDDDTGELDALTGWLGAGSGEPAPRVRSGRPSVPGRLLLCTDGLWRYLPGAEALRDRLAAAPASGRGGGPLDGARSLVGYALDAGGHDNVTALLLPVPAGVPPRAGSAGEV